MPAAAISTASGNQSRIFDGMVHYRITRLALSPLPALLLAGCYPGEPRTTKLQNRTNSSIVVRWVDYLGRDRKVEASAGGIADLSPNYRFDRLTELTITQGVVSFKLAPKQLKHLSEECSGSCTLTYSGNGRLRIAVWTPPN